MRKRRFRQLMLTLPLLMMIGGCTSHNYIVPPPIVKQYDEPLPFQCGFLMSRELRGQWYSSQTVRSRIDVPVGKVVLDFANAYLQNAFQTPRRAQASDVAPETTKDFYTIRYYERRSQEGLLIRVKSINYELTDVIARCALSIDIADAEGRAILTKVYEAEGTPEEGRGLLQKTIYSENAIELSTAAALGQIYTAILNDIRALYQQAMRAQQEKQTETVEENEPPALVPAETPRTE